MCVIPMKSETKNSPQKDDVLCVCVGVCLRVCVTNMPMCVCVCVTNETMPDYAFLICLRGQFAKQQ